VGIAPKEASRVQKLQPISRPERGIVHIAQETNRNDQGFHVRAEQLFRPGKPVVAPIR
jgi:hypothetical protein